MAADYPMILLKRRRSARDRNCFRSLLNQCDIALIRSDIAAIRTSNRARRTPRVSFARLNLSTAKALSSDWDYDGFRSALFRRSGVRLRH